jgi:prepilin-type processing-associated H-X9-DG protein
MYKIIGSDGQQYGPITAEQLRQWLTEGRVNTQTQVQPDGVTDWKPLGSLLEFASSTPPPLTPSPAPAPLASPKTSGLAIASLVLGILGFCSYGLTAIVGLILGLVGLRRINRSQGMLSGKRLAIAGISVSGVILVMIPLLAALLYPAVMRAKGKARRANCMSNIKQLGLGLAQYADDHTNQLPAAATWADAIKTYVGDSERIFQCPEATIGTFSYAFNANMSGAQWQGDPEVIVLIEAPLGWNATVAGPDSLPPPPHGDGRNVVFADGHASWISNSQINSLRWKPQPKSE